MINRDGNSEGERQPLLTDARSTSEHDSRGNTNVTLPSDHQHLLDRALYPEDAFSDRTYWADLAAKEQALWIKNQARKEASREWKEVANLAKAGPFRPIQAYLNNYAVAGVGFFIEGYVLFSVGNIMPLFKAVWPECYDQNELCSESSVKAIKYMEIVGIICGQIVVGYLGDAIGRRWGLIQDAGIMLVGTILLTAMWGASLQGWVVMYAIAIFVFGLGVGGEYPMTSTTSIEGLKGSEDRAHRGRSALLAFVMQGWGQLANQVVLIVLAVLVSNTKSLQPPYSISEVQIVFRVSFGVSVLCLTYFLYLRIFKLKSSDLGIKENRQSNKSSAYDWDSFKFVLSRFWARLLASSMCWFCSDFAFYGMQIFRNDLLKLVTGTTSSQVDIIWTYNLINIACQLAGYYLAAFMIDYKPYGRRRMQMVSFLALSIIFAGISVFFTSLNQAGSGANIFQALYFLANFWVQFGPNCTTFLLAAEIFPIGVRSTAHGFSAAMGKIGALAATVSFAYIGDRQKFILSTISTLIGLALTIFFIPDTTGLDLAEMQRAWGFVISGQTHGYHGVAVHKHHLSWFERLIRKRDRNYDLTSDREARVNELRKLYEKSLEAVEDAVNEGEKIDQDLIRYFEFESEYMERAGGSARPREGIRED